MNKNGIVLKKTNKRNAGSFLLFVFLLPYICACLWGHVGEDKGRLEAENMAQGQQGNHIVEAVLEWGVWELPMEEYLVYRLFLVMPGEYESETLKAQAVLLRTELAAQYLEEGESIRVAGDGLAAFYAEPEGVEAEVFSKSRQAVEETAGMILTYQGEPIRASYFSVSNGHTRAASEVECPYFSIVSCEQDKTSPDYHSVVEVAKEAYIEALAGIVGEECGREELWENRNFSYDDAGYMTSVSYFTEKQEEKRVDGETFRHLFGLASASFVAAWEEDRVLFSVTGAGHGYGLSQYGANCKAKAGETYEEILADFFFQTELAKFE
ncbi:MAG: SpoIID/LytB domain-containing protein [Lachnospiraceae bacterium]|nr:SpoIID/LytB domain-containing protein [Lachnospiraceae bacterium]